MFDSVLVTHRPGILCKVPVCIDGKEGRGRCHRQVLGAPTDVTNQQDHTEL